MSDALVRAAFETRLQTWADAQSPAIPIAFENVAFTPPTTRYIRAFMLPARTVSLTLEQTDRQRKGIYQVSLVLPSGDGVAAGTSLTAALDALFPTNVPMTQGSITVNLTSPMSAATPIQEGDRWVIPVSAYYQSDTH